MDELAIKQLIEKFSLEHIAIIMDGNGRWAKQHGLNRTEGHKVGSKKVIEVVRKADQLGIKVLSLYAFSTENWKRPKIEVSTLFNLLKLFVEEELDELVKNNVRLQIMGDISKLPFVARKAVEKAVDYSKNNSGLILNIGINYGSRDEIARAITNIIKDYGDKKLGLDEINPSTLSNYLYTNNLKDPDLLIRTGGEERLSNFMLYQLAYTEFYFTPVYWPDFDGDELQKAILKYLERDRRFGGLNE